MRNSVWRRLALLLTAALLWLGIVPALADFESIEISGIPAFGQRLSYTIPASVNPADVSVDVSENGGYVDCGVACVSMIEAYAKGYPSDDTRVYHAVIAARNPYVDWESITETPEKSANVVPLPLEGYFHSFGLGAENVYRQLQAGNPVMAHRLYTHGGYEHWVVIYGYEGPTTYMDWRNFLIMSPTYTGEGVLYQHLNDLVSDYRQLNCFMYRKTGLETLADLAEAERTASVPVALP